jgi:hypothetical protein
MKQDILDLYSDYLILGKGQATATGLSGAMDGNISHDKITRFLAGKGMEGKKFRGKDLWLKTKFLVRLCENDDAALIFDDTIIPKPYMDENEIVAWYFDHKENRAVKGIDLLSAFYWSSDDEGNAARFPIDFRIVEKTEYCEDKKSGTKKRKSRETKNEMMRAMVQQAASNDVKFLYVLMDSWFSSVDNMEFIAKKEKVFITELKLNRVAAMSVEDKKAGKFVRLNEIVFSERGTARVWLKSLPFAVNLCRQVFQNKDGSAGQRILASNDLGLDYEKFATLYQRRWSVEEYHKSLKENAGLGKSPARTALTQSNHIFVSIYAYLKPEAVKLRTGLNHFALKAKIYMLGLKALFKSLPPILAPIHFAISCVT